MRGPDAERLRRRCAAIGAAVLFLLCLLVALGQALLALVVVGALAVLAVALAAHQRRWDLAVLERLRSRARRARPAPAARPEPTYGWPSRIDSWAASDEPEATVETAAVAPARTPRPVLARVHLPGRNQLAPTLSRLLPGLQQRIRDSLAGAQRPAASPPSALEEEGRRCHALGVELRRAGRVRQAARLHEAARMMYEEVGDSRGEALAANALGVALAELGDEDAAVEQFQQARALLHEIGDRQWEGKVLANVGFAKHRVGREDEAVDLLRSALAKLSPETEAFQRVEQRLKRAS